MIHKGWHSRGYLLHFDSPETIQFVTFRLADSLPRAVTESLAKRPDGLAAIEAVSMEAMARAGYATLPLQISHRARCCISMV